MYDQGVLYVINILKIYKIIVIDFPLTTENTYMNVKKLRT